jgi:hypothetical protein
VGVLQRPIEFAFGFRDAAEIRPAMVASGNAMCAIRREQHKVDDKRPRGPRRHMS